MKTATIYLMVKTFLLLTFFLGILSCSKEKSTVKCTENLSFDQPVKISMENMQMSVMADLFNKRNAKKLNYQILTCNTTQSDYDELLKNINTQINEPSNAFEIVLYINKFLDDGDVKLSNILGYSLYTYIASRGEKGIIRHRLYIKENNVFIENKAYNMQTRGIITNMLTYIIENELSMERGNPKSYILIRSENRPIINLKNERDDFYLKKKLNKLFSLNFKEAPGGGTGEDCGGMCESNPQSVCEQDLTYNDYDCKSQPGGICPEADMVNELHNNGLLSTDSISAIFNSELHYSFRDNFLQSSNKGQKYVEYYYALGEMLVDKIPLLLRVKTARTLFKFNTCATLLLNAKDHPNEILINAQLNSELINLLNEYKNIMPNNTEYIFIIDAIISDVNYFSNKNINYIVSNLN